MKRSLACLVIGSSAFWLVVAYPARLVCGEKGVVFTAVAMLVCLLPMAATLMWGHWAFKGSPEHQLVAVMGGTVVRMAVVIAAGMVLFLLVDYFHHASFWIWIIIFYFFTLSLEIGLLLARHKGANQPKDIY